MGSEKTFSKYIRTQRDSTHQTCVHLSSLFFFNQFMLLLVTLNPGTLYVKGQEWLNRKYNRLETELKKGQPCLGLLRG